MAGDMEGIVEQVLEVRESCLLPDTIDIPCAGAPGLAFVDCACDGVVVVVGAGADMESPVGEGTFSHLPVVVARAEAAKVLDGDRILVGLGIVLLVPINHLQDRE